MDALDAFLASTGFIVYISVLSVVTVTMLVFARKFAHRHVLYLSIVLASFGSVSVIASKGIGLGIKQAILGEVVYNRWGFWCCFGILIFLLGIETVYTQRILDLFNVTLATSVQYVIFTSLILFVTITLFKESTIIGWQNVVLTIAGFLINISALYLLNLDKVNQTTMELESKEENKPAVPEVANSLTNEASSIANGHVDHLYELRRESKADEYMTPSCQTPIAIPLKSPLGNIPPAMFIDNAKSNSCMSLISETPSKIYCAKESCDSRTSSTSRLNSRFGSVYRNKVSDTHIEDQEERELESPGSSCSSRSSNDSSHSTPTSMRSSPEIKNNNKDLLCCTCAISDSNHTEKCKTHQSRNDEPVSLTNSLAKNSHILNGGEERSKEVEDCEKCKVLPLNSNDTVITTISTSDNTNGVANHVNS